MILAYPSFCSDFACIAGKCRHTCCRGWEIDIDPASFERFSVHPDIVCHIGEIDGQMQFLREPDGKCPFLDSDGLCAMIRRYGKEMLCDICADHPRFRNFFPDRTEIGLGLCCEAAAGLILSRRESVRIIETSDGTPSDEPDEDESYILGFRDNLTRIVQDRTKPFAQRIEDLLDYSECEFPDFTGEEVYDLLISLERLDPAWEEMIAPLRSVPVFSGVPIPSEADIMMEQAAVCFIWRHIAPAWEDDALAARVLLCVFLIRLSAVLFFSDGCCNHEKACECLRMLSCEIEYSDENIDILLEQLENEQTGLSC